MDIPRLFTSIEDKAKLSQFVAVLVALGIELLVFAGRIVLAYIGGSVRV